MTEPQLLPAVPSALTARRRSHDLQRLTDGWRPDVLVVGAGVTGAGIALDAVTRGLSVALVDRADLANGTSRWSSKLVHGGLRYLAKGDVALAHESAVERGILMEHVAPHLTRSLEFITPVNDGMPTPTAVLAGLGYGAGAALRLSARSSSRTLPGPRWLGATQVLQRAPAVGRVGLKGGLSNHDGQLVDDVRLVVALCRTAAAFGAAVLPRVTVSEVQRDRVTLQDTVTGERADAVAGRVVIAAGVWSDTLDERVALRPSKGVHLVFDGRTFGMPRAAVTAPVPDHFGRFVFALPQPDGRVYLGLTDDEHDGLIPDEPTVTDAERDFLLRTISAVLERPLTAADVVGSFAGFRPLIAGQKGASADLSRTHAVLDEEEGPITIVGGKLTTYRRMAADVVDLLSDRPATTNRQPLVGALPRHRLRALPHPRWLVDRYGREAADLHRLLIGSPRLARPIVDDMPYLMVEAVQAISREGAMTMSDILDRRMRIGLSADSRSSAAAHVTETLTDLGVTLAE